MERYITDERTGLKYELIGDHYLIAGENEPEERSIGVWSAASSVSQGAPAGVICQPTDQRRIERLSCGS